MPWTGLAFLVGRSRLRPAAASGSWQLLVYLGLFRVVIDPGDRVWLAGAFAAPALAYRCTRHRLFRQAFGAAFAEGRTERVQCTMRAPHLLPMAARASGCS
jgi:hypothetical protein